MTVEKYKLSGDEKLRIFEKHAKIHGIKVGKKMVIQIKNIDSSHGFPHCVEMFCTNAFLRKSGMNFFRNPEFVQKELHNFNDNDPLKFLVLLLVLYKGNHVHQRYFGEMIEQPDEEVAKLFKFTGIPLSNSYASMIKAVNALSNTYLIQTADGYYRFTHESLKEHVSDVYISLNPFHAAHLLDFQQILTHVNKPTVNVKLSENELAERITIELLSGGVDSVSACTLWLDQMFVDEWIRFVTLTFESSRLPSYLSKFLLGKILIPDNSRWMSLRDKSLRDEYYARHSKALITSLLENEMDLAAIAILNSKF